VILRRALQPLLAGLALAVSAGALSAQSDPTLTARAAMVQLEVATQALQDAQKSGDRIAALTQTVQAYEEGLSALRDGLRRINLREAALEAAFEAERDRLGQLLGVLQTIGKAPEPALLVHPSGPLGTARSGMILSEVTPALQAQADDLRARLEEQRTLRALQKLGVWIYGLEGEATTPIHAIDLTGNIALVMGGEGEGMRRLTREHCDGLVKIPMPGEMESLNVSVATGVALFEAVRQRGAKP